MNTEIKLIRTPEIAHRLVDIGASVTARLNDLGIESLVATEDTVKGLKELRAELNKELTDFEEQRKFVKNGILNPYNEFELVYKEQVSEKYTKAINTLKDKIAVVETKIKDDKAASVKRYFDELIVAENVEFLKFEQLGLDINLSTTEKKYKEQVNEFVTKVNDDLALIKTTDFEAEILTEYKKTMNVSLAITSVKTRKDNERIEAEKLHQAEIKRRKEHVSRLSMVYLDMTDSFEFDDEILIRREDLERLSKSDFELRMIKIESLIGDKRNKIAKEKEADASAVKHEVSAPVSAPVVVSSPKVTEETVTASFKVEGTMAQLRSLGSFMKENNIKYSNI